MTNDDDAPSVPGPDAYGQAALLLVESLIHGLVARSVITVAEAVEIVHVAEEVKLDIAEDKLEAPATTAKSLQLLRAIGASLEIDLPTA